MNNLNKRFKRLISYEVFIIPGFDDDIENLEECPSQNPTLQHPAFESQ